VALTPKTKEKRGKVDIWIKHLFVRWRDCPLACVQNAFDFRAPTVDTDTTGGLSFLVVPTREHEWSDKECETSRDSS
jgi:hypothetical protein